jgi:hypothetical protein
VAACLESRSQRFCITWLYFTAIAPSLPSAPPCTSSNFDSDVLVYGYDLSAIVNIVDGFRRSWQADVLVVACCSGCHDPVFP